MACVVALLAGCQPELGVLISNQTKEDVKIWHQGAGERPTLFVPRMPPLGGSEWRGSLFSGSDTCERGARLIAETESGKRYTFGPPLCRKQEWHIGERPLKPRW